MACVEAEKAVLKRFLQGKVVSKTDRAILEKYAKTGIVKYGFSFKKRRVEAKLTEAGRVLIGE